MRTLVIAGEYPWPVNSGSRMRLLTTLRSLSRAGPTELFSVVPGGRADFDPPDPALELARVGRVAYDDGVGLGVRLLSTVLRPSLPFGLPRRDRPSVRRALQRFVSGSYDLVWCFGVRSWVLAGEPRLAPTVLDVDDLEDHKIHARLAIAPGRPRSGVWAGARAAGARWLSEAEIRRWRRLHRRAGRRTAVIVVCSDLDADRVRATGVKRVEVVPNGYRQIDEPLGRIAVDSPPTVLFHGTLRYPPNADAARFLAEEVGPCLRRSIEEVRIRLVGITSPALARLHDPPRLTVVDHVPDISTELARADVVVVPMRFGSGTRVKILEAFAHRIPVVSTTIGAEGLGATDGVHLLIADDAVSMAEACARVLSDMALRDALTTRAHALFLEHFANGVVEETIRRVAADAVRT